MKFEVVTTMLSVPIYCITVMTEDMKHKRVIGFYYTILDCHRAIKLNQGEMHEYLYDWLCLEVINEGAWKGGVVLRWYKWSDEESDSLSEGNWVPIEGIPGFAQNIINFSMG